MITIEPVTLQLLQACYRDFENDPDIFMDMSLFQPYRYDAAKVEARYKAKYLSDDRRDFLIMCDGLPIGEVGLKHIDWHHRQGELTIHMQNDAVKGKGYGTQTERLLLSYAFRELGLELVTAETVLKNTRSQHVLEKVGFTFIREAGIFRYYQITRQKFENL